MRRVACVLASVVVTAAFLAACQGSPNGPTGSGASPSSIPVGHSSRTYLVDGVERTVLLYRPEGVTDPAPLVVMLHGGFGSARQAEASYGWDDQADEAHYIVAYPDGSSRAWNAGTCCGLPAATDVDDVGFIVDAVHDLRRDAAVDPGRVYATGMSNGAMLAYRLACETDVFAAIAPVAGTMLVDCAQATPTSVLHIHGVADERVPYGGGPGEAVTATGAPRVDGPSVPDAIATWRAIDRCGAAVVAVDRSVTTSSASCPEGRAVELLSIEGAGHQWPGSAPNAVAEQLGADPPSRAIDATRVIWEFFSAHP